MTTQHPDLARPPSPLPLEEQSVALDQRLALWGEGPWLTEPDRREWHWAGFPCLMVRHPSMGHWCGYVGVPPGHPWHGQDGDELDVPVHGGLTYSRECSGLVCHVPHPGEPEHLWWLGFDCAHSGDLSPSTEKLLGVAHGTSTMGEYRDKAWVVAECERLARQALAARSSASKESEAT